MIQHVDQHHARTADEFGATGDPFKLDGRMTVRKSDDGKMLIEGILSSESVDADGEIVVQDGLDFGYFLKSGWFNDNHKQDTSAGLGVPLSVEQVTLANGKRATRVLGELFDIPESRKIFALAQAAGDRRPLGFSLEGAIVHREGAGGKIVARAKVRDCSITRHPKNPDSTFSALVKALAANEVPNVAPTTPPAPLRRPTALHVVANLPTPDLRKSFSAGYNEPGTTTQPLVAQDMSDKPAGKVASATYSAAEAIDRLATELGVTLEAARRIYQTLKAQRAKKRS